MRAPSADVTAATAEHDAVMRFLLLGWGSRGDVEPFVALGRGLRAAGHDVALAAGRDYAPWVESHGLTPEPFGVDMQEAMRSPLGRRWLGNANTTAELRAMSQAVRSFTPVLADDLLRIVRPDDVVVSSSLTFDSMLAISQARGCRHVTALFTPGIPTRSPAASLAPVRSGSDSALNVASGYLALAVLHRVLRPAGAQVRERLGLSGQSFWAYGEQGRHVPVLMAVSPTVLPAPPDWGPRVRVTGYWALPAPTPEQAGAAVPPEIRAFLDAGEPPVYLGFGSMTSPNPRATTELLFEAVRRSGLRAIIHRGVDRLGMHGVPDDLATRMLLTDSVPHAWLLPRCVAVVTHGGSGSAGAGLRAGVPSMAVPHMGDQPYWGRRLHDLGVGPAPIRRADLTAANLADALTTLTTSPGMAHRAVVVATRLAREDGVGTAVELLGNYLANSGRRG